MCRSLKAVLQVMAQIRKGKYYSAIIFIIISIIDWFIKEMIEVWYNIVDVLLFVCVKIQEIWILQTLGIPDLPGSQNIKKEVMVMDWMIMIIEEEAIVLAVLDHIPLFKDLVQVIQEIGKDSIKTH